MNDNLHTAYFLYLMYDLNLQSCTVSIEIYRKLEKNIEKKNIQSDVNIF